MNTRDTYFGGPLHSDLTVDGIVYNYLGQQSSLSSLREILTMLQLRMRGQMMRPANGEEVDEQFWARAAADHAAGIRAQEEGDESKRSVHSKRAKLLTRIVCSW